MATSSTTDCTRHHQPLADEQAHLLDVVGGADHQLAGLVAIVVAERQALDLGEQLVAEVEGDVLGDALGVVLLAEGEQGAHDGEDDDGQHRGEQGWCDGARVRAGLDAADDGVDDDVDELGDDELGEGGDEQAAVGQGGDAPVAPGVGHRAAGAWTDRDEERLVRRGAAAAWRRRGSHWRDHRRCGGARWYAFRTFRYIVTIYR